MNRVVFVTTNYGVLDVPDEIVTPEAVQEYVEKHGVAIHENAVGAVPLSKEHVEKVLWDDEPYEELTRVAYIDGPDGETVYERKE